MGAVTASISRARPDKACNCGGPGRRSFALLGLALLLLVAAHASAAAQAARPQRIVSLDLCADQILIDLVPRERIKALTHLAADPAVSVIPERARGYPITHGNAEDVLRHDPDLVLAGPYGVSPTVSLLRRLGRNVVIVPLAVDLGSVRDAVMQVARAVGEEARGARQVSEFDARLQRLAHKVAALPARPSALIYQVGGWAPGSGTLANSALTAAGFHNAADAYVLTRNGQVPLEALVAQPPDVLVLASPQPEYRTIAADNLRHPAVQALKHRVRWVEVPARTWLCGTPHIIDAIEQMSAVHP